MKKYPDHLLVCAAITALWLHSGSPAAAQTNPVLNIALDPQGFPLLSWQSQSNRLFNLEVSTNLSSAPWLVTSATNLQLTLTGMVAGAKVLQPGGQQFFRLRTTPINRFGANASAGNRPDDPNFLNDLGASWTRVNDGL